jgi:hypothetical protein
MQQQTINQKHYFCIMEWFESWFDTPYYHLLYSNRDYTEAENFITKLTAELQLPTSSKSLILPVVKEDILFFSIN